MVITQGFKCRNRFYFDVEAVITMLYFKIDFDESITYIREVKHHCELTFPRLTTKYVCPRDFPCGSKQALNSPSILVKDTLNNRSTLMSWDAPFKDKVTGHQWIKLRHQINKPLRTGNVHRKINSLKLGHVNGRSTNFRWKGENNKPPNGLLTPFHEPLH